MIQRLEMLLIYEKVMVNYAALRPVYGTCARI